MVSEDRQSRSVRVLVEPSDYLLRNAGDMAMLRTAVSRLIQRWPNALIQVLSDEPDALQAFCPEATPLPSDGRQYWLQMVRVPERFPPRGATPCARVSQGFVAPQTWMAK